MDVTTNLLYQLAATPTTIEEKIALLENQHEVATEELLDAEDLIHNLEVTVAMNPWNANEGDFELEYAEFRYPQDLYSVKKDLNMPASSCAASSL